MTEEMRKSNRGGISKKKYAAFTLVAISIFFCSLEALARVWLFLIASPVQFGRYALYDEVRPQNRRFSPHPYLNYYSTPNYVSLNGLSRHNSYGFRGKDIQVPKPKGLFRIAILGGSTVYSTAVEDDEKVFTAILEKTLKERYGHTNVEVVNAGCGGYNSWESLVDLEFRILDIEPDLVVVYHGTNDVHARLVNPKAYRGDDSGRRKQWSAPKRYFYESSVFLRILNKNLKIFRVDQNNIDYFVDAPTTKQNLIDTGYNEILGGTPMETLERNPPIYYERNLRNMVAIAKEHGVQIVLATWAWSPYFNQYTSAPHYIKGFEECNQVVKEVAETHHVPFFDFANLMPKDKQYWADGAHENEKGSVVKAEIWAQYLHKSGLL